MEESKLNLFLVNINFLFLFLLLPALVWGSFAADLVISIMSLIFLFQTFKYRLFAYYNNILVKFLILFYIYLFIRSLFSDFEIGLNNSIKIFFYFRFIIFVVALSYVILKKENIIIKYKFFLYIFLYVLIFDGLLQFFFGRNLVGYPLGLDGRIGSFFYDEYVFGSFLSKIFPIFIAIAFYNQKQIKNRYFVLFFNIIIFLFVVFLSGERTAFILLLFAALLLIFSFKIQKRILYFLIISMTLIAIIFSFHKDHRLFDRYLVKTSNEVQSIIRDNLNKKILTNQYFDQGSIYTLMFSTSLKMYNSNKLFGLGPKTFSYYCDKYDYFSYSNELRGCSSHPHNIYFQLLAETGIVGFSFVFIFFIYLFFLIFKNLFYIYFKKEILHSSLETCMHIALFVNLWPLAFSGNFFNNWISILYFLPIGFLLNRINRSKLK